MPANVNKNEIINNIISLEMPEIPYKIKNKNPLENKKLEKNEIIAPKVDLNPVGPNSEIYKKNILKRQKILILMIHQEYYCNIEKLFKNSDNKTVNDAAVHFRIEIVTINNYDDAIKEITKEENGKCPYYACWTMSSEYEQDKTKQFLELLVIFWINGGAVVLFSDNNPFIIETNIFLSIISAGFTMDGDYDGQKKIHGDDTGLLQLPLFKKKYYI